MIKGLKFQLTFNNPDEHGITYEYIIEKLMINKSIVYYAMCREIGENGTPHIHVFVCYSQSMRFTTLKKHFPTECHIERCLGSYADNRAYILKEGDKYADKKETSVEGSFIEWGVLPVDVGQGRRVDLEILYELIKNGASNKEIFDYNPNYITFSSHIEKTRQTVLEAESAEVFRELEVVYLFGATAVGKTRYVMEKYGYKNVHKVTNYKNPFDKYEGQECILFDEFLGELPLTSMNCYLDGYPINLPARYADKCASYTHVYIVANIPLQQQYVNEQQFKPEIFKAFIRRINEVYCMDFRGMHKLPHRNHREEQAKISELLGSADVSEKDADIEKATELFGITEIVKGDSDNAE
jgi:hypothetical protein